MMPRTRNNPPTGDPILDALRAERERRGWSQTELAQRIGRQTYNTPYLWESGTNEPTLSSLREWAGALGYNVTLTAREPTEQTRAPDPAADDRCAQSSCGHPRKWHNARTTLGVYPCAGDVASCACTEFAEQAGDDRG